MDAHELATSSRDEQFEDDSRDDRGARVARELRASLDLDFRPQWLRRTDLSVSLACGLRSTALFAHCRCGSLQLDKA